MSPRGKIHHVFVEVADARWLDDVHLKEAARVVVQLLTFRKNAKVYWVFAGFDDDPRELADIPEVAVYVRRLAGMVGWKDRDALPYRRIDDDLVALLGWCGCFAPIEMAEVEA